MGNFFVDNPPPSPYGNDFTPRDAQGNPNVGVRQAPPAPAAPVAPQSPATPGDPHAEFMQAVQALGIDPHQLRGNVDLMNKVSAYLNQQYPGQNWTNGGQRAGDWFGYGTQGQGLDVLPVGDANFQTLDDSANSTAGSGGDSGYGGYSFASNGLTPTQQIEQIPGYQFSVDQAMNAIQHSAAARGTLLSGGLMKNLGSYIANSVAGPAYQQQVGNLYNLAGLGKSAAGMTGDAAGAYGNAASGLITGIGNANAGATLAGGSAYGNAATNIGNTAAQIYAARQNPDPYGRYPGFPGGGTDPFAANASGYAANGVNQTGVTYTRPTGG